MTVRAVMLMRVCVSFFFAHSIMSQALRIALCVVLTLLAIGLLSSTVSLAFMGSVVDGVGSLSRQVAAPVFRAANISDPYGRPQ